MDVNIIVDFSSGFMSPPPQSDQIQNNPIAMQLRGSQANLQQALRLHEDLSRQVFKMILIH